jgi:hypothetical protein
VNRLLLASDDQLSRLDQMASVVSALLAALSFPATGVSLVFAIRAQRSAVESRPLALSTPERPSAEASELRRAPSVGRGSQGVQIGDRNTQNNLNLDPSAVLPSPSAVPVPAGLHNLPLASTVFVGRDLGTLDGLLDRGRGVIGQAVHGLGGVGKPGTVS